MFVVLGIQHAARIRLLLSVACPSLKLVSETFHMLRRIKRDTIINTGYTQKNGTVSNVNKKFISHLTRAQRIPSAAATVQVSHTLPAVRFLCLLRGRGARIQDGVAARKGFLCVPF